VNVTSTAAPRTSPVTPPSRRAARRTRSGPERHDGGEDDSPQDGRSQRTDPRRGEPEHRERRDGDPRRGDETTWADGAGDDVSEAVRSRRRHPSPTRNGKGEAAQDEGEGEAGDTEPTIGQRAEGEHLHHQHEHERDDTERADVAASHDLERLPGGAARAEAVGGVGEAVEVHRAGQGGEQADDERGGEQGRRRRAQGRGALSQQPEQQPAGHGEEAADGRREHHGSARDVRVDPAWRSRRENGQRADREAYGVAHHSRVTRPATHHRTSSVSAASRAFR
jgi:hypothetical protein